MQTIENLKELIKQALLKNEGELKLREHKEITGYAKDIGLDNRKLSKLIQEVDASINWEYIKQQETDLVKKEKSAKRVVRKRINTPTSAKLGETVITTPDSGSIIQTSPKNNKKIITLKRVLIASCIVLIYLAIIIEDAPKTEAGTTMFSYIEALTIRKEPNINSDNNIIGQLYYGDSLKVLSIDSNSWAYCVAEDKKGYVAAEYLMDKKDFYELDCIFADEEARKAIKYSYWRKGILKYFTSRGIIGNLGVEMQYELYGYVLNSEKWQFLVSHSGIFNTFYVTSEDIYTPSYQNLGILIRNVETGKRKFLLFGFQANASPILLDEEDAPPYGNIKQVYKTNNGNFKVKYVK